MSYENGYHITLDTTMPTHRRWQWRFPRTKKRRIRNKWRARPENWRSCLHVVQSTLMLGANAAKRIGAQLDADKLPTMLSMHPKNWPQVGARIRSSGAKVEIVEAKPFAWP